MNTDPSHNNISIIQDADQRPPRPDKYPWWPYRALAQWEYRLGAEMVRRGGWRLFLYEFLRFGLKQAWACLFGGLMLALIIGTYLWYPAHACLSRYDFLVISALIIQAVLLVTRMETLAEAKVILLFHIVGTVMEIFKTYVGSWQYPETSILRIGGVPLFTGFMYASVGSYLARVWRLFDFRFTRHPPFWATIGLSIAIYVNFFSHHYIYDFRWLILVLVLLAFGPCIVHFRIHRHHRRMPLVVGFLLVALFIWFAENIGTFTKAWLYPNQSHGWSMVSLGKLSAWYLLMIISYVMVSTVNRPQAFNPGQN